MKCIRKLTKYLLKQIEDLFFSILLVILGIVLVFLSGNIADNYWQFTGLLFSIGFASCLCGGLFGILFGIPKVNKNYHPSDDYGAKVKYETNTNLEDISDWLTKIIVGATLTQVSKISSMFIWIADYVIKSGNFKPDYGFGKPIVISIIIYFLISGFIISYFYIRLYLADLLNMSDQKDFQKEKNKVWKKGAKKIQNLSSCSVMMENNENLKPTEYVLLTDEEKRIIDKIKKSNNNELTLDKSITKSDYPAISVLIDKRIITVLDGKELGPGVTIILINKNIIEMKSDNDDSGQ